MQQTITEKECTLCHKIKPITEFVSEFTTSGYTNRCADCRQRGQKAHSKYVDKNRDKINKWHADYSRNRQSAEPEPGLRRCPRCWEELPLEQFPIGPDGHRRKQCVACRAYCAVQQIEWRNRNPDKASTQRTKAINRRREQRRACLEHYGLACACCGDSHYDFLTLDHIDGKGNLHRREIASTAIFGWIIRQGFPGNFRTLCWNCNWGCRLNNGICPHQLEKQAA